MNGNAKVYGPGGVLWATAPDATWKLRGEPFPEPGALVEACWVSRFKNPQEVHFARLRMKSSFIDGTHQMSIWMNEQGQELLLAPDFWRPTL